MSGRLQSDRAQEAVFHYFMPACGKHKGKHYGHAKEIARKESGCYGRLFQRPFCMPECLQSDWAQESIFHYFWPVCGKRKEKTVILQMEITLKKSGCCGRLFQQPFCIPERLQSAWAQKSIFHYFWRVCGKRKGKTMVVKMAINGEEFRLLWTVVPAAFCISGRLQSDWA